MTNLNEIWLEIPNYEGLYEISNFGNIRSLDKYVNTNLRHVKSRLIKGKNIKPKTALNRCKFIQLHKNGNYVKFLMHRLVAQSFIPNPTNKATVNHKDFDRANNHVNNLEWCTTKENNHHASSKILKGENSSSSKLNDVEVAAIREMQGKIKGTVLARELGISSSNIYSIWKNQTWKLE